MFKIVNIRENNNLFIRACECVILKSDIKMFIL